MSEMRKPKSRRRGSALLVTLLALVALTVLGLSTIMLSGFDGEIALNQRAGEQALYVAEAGVHWGIREASLDFTKVTNGWSTVGWGGANPDVDISGFGATVAFPGVNQPAKFAVQFGTSEDELGNTVVCGIPGYSDTFGSRRFRVSARGYGPAGSMREVEAHVLEPPVDGACPPAGTVQTGTYGS